MDTLRSGDPGSVGGYRLLGRLGAGGMGRVFLGVLGAARAGLAPRAQRSGHRSRVRSRRRLAALVVAVAAAATLAATVPVMLTRGAPERPNPGGTSGAPDPATTGAVPVRDLTLHTHFGALFGNVAFSPDGTLLVAGLDGHAYLWDVASGQPIATLTAPGGGPGYEAFSPDGRLLADADGSWDRVYLWDVATGRRAATLIPPGVGAIAGVAFSPDGKLLAIADGDGNIYVRVTSQFMP